MSQKYVYVMLSKSTTLVSRLIYLVTRRAYTHSSMSIDPTMMDIYSFCRIYPRFALPAGFSNESLHKGFYRIHTDIPCRVYRMKITDLQWEMLESVFKRMYASRKKFRYDVTGGIFYFIKKKHRRYNYRYCSWFLSEVLGELEIMKIHKDYSLFEPVDFDDVEGLEVIYEGKVGDLRQQIEEGRLLDEENW